MPYPTYLMISLEEINGNSCGNRSQRVAYVPESDPPYYLKSGIGQLTYVKVSQMLNDQNETTWKINLTNTASGSCLGSHVFERSTAADDPTGDFYRVVSGQMSSDNGIVTSVNDD